jgi:hypothetical protein
VLVVLELPLVVLVDVAALAIAAPPPTSADVTAIVTSSGFNLRIRSPPFVGPFRTVLARRRTPVGGT